MTGLDTSTLTPARIITGRFPPQRFPARLVAPPPAALNPPPPHALGDLLADTIYRPPAPQTHERYRCSINCWLSWLFDARVRLPSADAAAIRSAAELIPGTANAAALARLCAVTEGDVIDYLNHVGRDGRNLAATSINSRLTMIRLFYRRLHRHGLVALDPTIDLRSRKMPPHSSTAWLSRDQARQLLAAIAGDRPAAIRDRALIGLMLRTGLRASEARTALAEDLDTTGGHAILFVTGKGGQRERVKVPPDVLADLRRWLDHAQIATGLIFRRVNMGTINQQGALSKEGFRQMLHARFAAANLTGLVPHSLRHTFITLAIKGGASLPKVQMAARHRNPTTTMRYAHDLDGLDDHAADYIQL